MALGEARLRSIVESLLMISPEPLPVARLIEVIRIEDPQTEEEAIKAAINGLLGAYGDADRPVARGFRIEEIAGALQLRTVAENAQYVRRYLSAKPQRLSKASLETLAIIAYRQPVSKPEVEAIRGVDVGAAIKNLLERDMIKILGKRDEVGRPIIYGTTKAFLEFFGLRSLAELPTLREYHELDEEHQAEVDQLDEGKKTSIAELAQAASFMVDRIDDPDLKTLDEAVKDADRVGKAASEVLNPPKPEGAEGADAPSDESAGP
jgi:segregation and condensation protein B